VLTHHLRLVRNRTTIVSENYLANIYDTFFLTWKCNTKKQKPAAQGNTPYASQNRIPCIKLTSRIHRNTLPINTHIPALNSQSGSLPEGISCQFQPHPASLALKTTSIVTHSIMNTAMLVTATNQAVIIEGVTYPRVWRIPVANRYAPNLHITQQHPLIDRSTAHSTKHPPSIPSISAL